jgi:anti-sigma28 factor (negative regulator of flagellin synthesis)
MKVVGNINGIYSAYKKEGVNSKKASNITSDKKFTTDKLDISSDVKQKRFDTAEIEYLKSKTEIREERAAKIADLKAQINAGTYNVPLEDVADAILSSKEV